MNIFARSLRHLFSISARRKFPQSALDAISKAIQDSEATHDAEVCFTVESHLSLLKIFQRQTARQRAKQVFARLGIWDTELNSGVLIYILLADQAIEIIADRGVAAVVPADEWESVHQTMAAEFTKGNWQKGVLDGIEVMQQLLAKYLPPAAGVKANEIPDKALIDKDIFS